jgi:hypothetical protein
MGVAHGLLWAESWPQPSGRWRGVPRRDVLPLAACVRACTALPGWLRGQEKGGSWTSPGERSLSSGCPPSPRGAAHSSHARRPGRAGAGLPLSLLSYQSTIRRAGAIWSCTRRFTTRPPAPPGAPHWRGLRVRQSRGGAGAPGDVHRQCVGAVGQWACKKALGSPCGCKSAGVSPGSKVLGYTPSAQGCNVATHLGTLPGCSSGCITHWGTGDSCKKALGCLLPRVRQMQQKTLCRPFPSLYTCARVQKCDTWARLHRESNSDYENAHRHRQRWRRPGG